MLSLKQSVNHERKHFISLLISLNHPYEFKKGRKLLPVQLICFIEDFSFGGLQQIAVRAINVAKISINNEIIQGQKKAQTCRLRGHC